MTIRIDASDLMEFARDCDLAAEAAPALFGNVVKQLGFQIETETKNTAQANHRVSGTMVQSIRMAAVTVTSTGASAEVTVSAVSGKGFPYPIAVDQGRRGFARTSPSGKTYFVGPYTGSKFFTNAVDAARTDAADTTREALDQLMNLLKD